MRVLVRVLLALLVVVTSTSAFVRLAQDGLACRGAPDCYATKGARAAAEQSTGVAVARTLHRMAASAAGATLVAMVFLGWRGATRRERGGIAALAALAIALASLGQFLPSGLPALTLGNLLGGLTMLGVAAWLATAMRRERPAASARALHAGAWLAIALVALQAALGGLVSAQHAAFACATFPLCGDVAQLRLDAFDPLRELALPADAAQRAEPARQLLVLAHRALGGLLILMLAWLGTRASRAGLPWVGRSLVALALAQLVLGVAQALGGQPLALAVAHNLAAAGVAIAFGVLVERSRAK